jgi:hypothetical protein
MSTINDRATTPDSTGWRDADRNAPEIAALRGHLEANNGIEGLELFTPDQVESIVRVFRRDGFVVVTDVLTPDQLDFLRGGCDEVVSELRAVDPDGHGNRGSHRYSFGSASSTNSQIHRPQWQMLLDLPTLTPIITAIFGRSDYVMRGAGGDMCLPGAHRYPPLHSDLSDWGSDEATPSSTFHDPGGVVSVRDLPCPHVCANFLTVDATPINGATRQIPGTQHSRNPIPSVDDEPEWMKLSAVCPAPAGSVQLRDVRAWHGGTPNLSDEVRSIPNVEFNAPWFRELVYPCISHADHKKLSEHAQRLTRFHVMDSSEEFTATTRLNRTPPRMRTTAPS